MISGAFASMFYALACYAERRALTAAFLGGAAGSRVVYMRGAPLDIGPVIAFGNRGDRRRVSPVV